MIQALRKVKDMATAASGEGGVPKWVSYVQPAINAILVMIIVGLFGTFMVANSAATGVANHEVRLGKVEDKLSKQDVLSEKIDFTNKRMDELALTLRETNQRLDDAREQRRMAR